MSVHPMPDNENQQNQQYLGVAVNDESFYPQSQQNQSLQIQTEGQIQTQQNQITAIVQQNEIIYQPVVDLTAMAMQKIQIPDEVLFEHVFEKISPCIGGTWSEKSIFNIAGLGKLWMGVEYKKYFGFWWIFVPPSTRRQKKFFVYHGLCNSHYFRLPDYIIENEHIEMDYWNRIGTIIVGGIPLLQFSSTLPNVCDTLYGHCCVGYPKVVMYFLLDPQKQPLLIVPDKSECPETIFSFCGECAICGVCTTMRNFKVEGLSQGSCTILNTRTCSDAFAKAYLLQGDLCCPHVDYPRFHVNFVNVLPVDRLAILLALVHYNIIKKWYVMVYITRTTVGVA